MRYSFKNFLFSLTAVALLFLYGCGGPRTAFMTDYNFNKIKKVGVLKFDSSQVSFTTGYDPGYMVADEFVFQFINNGVRVIERSRLEDVIKEHKLWKSGDIDPATIKEMGKILGVDALLLGTVTRYIPDEKKRIYIKTRQGEVQEDIFLVNAEVGINARLVDTVTGEVVWAGAYSYDSFYIETAIKHTVEAMFNSLTRAW
jgi:hypothetical protein